MKYYQKIYFTVYVFKKTFLYISLKVLVFFFQPLTVVCTTTTGLVVGSSSEGVDVGVDVTTSVVVFSTVVGSKAGKLSNYKFMCS